MILGIANATWPDVALALVPTVAILVTFFLNLGKQASRDTQDQMQARQEDVHDLVNDRMDKALAEIEDLKKRLAQADTAG